MHNPPTLQERFTGCLLGGAAGDALGAPVEFLSHRQIIDQFGPDGISEYSPVFGELGKITDDTQMTLFTAEGLIRGFVRGNLRGISHLPSLVSAAYMRWLITQKGYAAPEMKERIEDHLQRTPGWLYQQPELHDRRAPGATCLSALESMSYFGDLATNNSKGCGGVMRVAPVGLFYGSNNDGFTAFEIACEIAAITHGHPSGILSSGVFAQIITHLANGESLQDALTQSKVNLKRHDNHEETLHLLTTAEELATSDAPYGQAIERIGEGWVAEEALAISVYCALVSRNFRHGVTLAVNHDGDSDSTGSITGNMLGVMHGVGAIPESWLKPLELRDVITEIAEDLLASDEWDIGEFDGKDNDWVWEKYPGC